MEELKQQQDHHTSVQMNIYEIMDNQRDKRLRNIELQAVIDGYANYLTRQGYSGIEIAGILKTLKYTRFVS